MKKYYAAVSITRGRCFEIKRDDSIVITEVTETRVRGTRSWPYSLAKDFDVKREPIPSLTLNSRFSVGSGSGKKRFLLCEEVK